MQHFFEPPASHSTKQALQGLGAKLTAETADGTREAAAAEWWEPVPVEEGPSAQMFELRPGDAAVSLQLPGQRRALLAAQAAAGMLHQLWALLGECGLLL